MAYSIGIDIVEIERFDDASDSLLDRLFTEAERDYISQKGVGAAQTAAGMYAAKEALGKALGGGLSADLLHGAEVHHTVSGKPFFRFAPLMAEIILGHDCSLTITHDAGAAVACVLLTAGDEPLLHAEEWVKWQDIIPRRNPDAHKYDNGHLFILAGSSCLSGAARMATRAALRMGVGLVTVGVPDCIFNIVAADCCEAMVVPLPDDGAGCLSADALPIIRDCAQSATAILAGPGLGTGEDIAPIVNDLLDLDNKCPLVLDADGLKAVNRHIFIQRRDVILTPHEGEFKRLGGQLPQLPRPAAAVDLATRTGCHVLLKGPDTVTAWPDGRTIVNPSGNCGLAKGGSGDILAGMVGALAAQGIGAGHAAAFAAFVHGCAADNIARRASQMGMVATDLLDEIPNLLHLFNSK